MLGSARQEANASVPACRGLTLIGALHGDSFEDVMRVRHPSSWLENQTNSVGIDRLLAERTLVTAYAIDTWPSRCVLNKVKLPTPCPVRVFMEPETACILLDAIHGEGKAEMKETLFDYGFVFFGVHPGLIPRHGG